MNKKSFVLLFLVAFLTFLVGCGKETKSLEINNSKIEILVGESSTLVVSNASSSVSFSSSNDEIASVDNNGKITAVSVGTAIITISDDDENKTCEVVVIQPEYDGIYLLGVDTDVIDLIVSDEYELDPYLLRGVDVVSGVKFKYTSFNEDVVTVDGNKIKALKEGEAYVQIDATEYENTSKIIKVIVKNDLTIDLSSNNITLSKTRILDYTESKEISYIIKNNGTVLEGKTLSVSISDEDVVSVEKNNDKYVINALKIGKATVTLSYKAENGDETTSYINVEVIKPIIELEEKYYFSKTNGLINFAELNFTEFNVDPNAYNCLSVYDLANNSYDIKQKTNKSLVIDTTSNIKEDGQAKKIYCDMDDYIVSFNIIQCTLAIKTVDDFMSMSNLLTEKRADDGKFYKRVDGYIALVNDLDFEGVEYKPFSGYYEIDKLFAGRSGFNAIFEGNYKTLKNIKLGSDTIQSNWNSIFGNVGWDAKIRNLAIVDCSFGEKATGAVFADYFHGAASNIFISATISNGFAEELENTSSGFSIVPPYRNSTIDQVTIVIKNTLPEKYNGVLSIGVVTPAFEGTYNLSNSPIKNLVCIGGGDEAKVLAPYATVKAINSANGTKGYIAYYDTFTKARNSVIADNGSTSFDVVDDKLQIKYNGTVVFAE